MIEIKDVSGEPFRLWIDPAHPDLIRMYYCGDGGYWEKANARALAKAILQLVGDGE